MHIEGAGDLTNWNAIYMQEVLTHLKAEGWTIDEADLAWRLRSSGGTSTSSGAMIFPCLRWWPTGVSGHSVILVPGGIFENPYGGFLFLSGVWAKHART